MTVETLSSVEAKFEASLKENGIPPCPVALNVIGTEMQKDDPDIHILERAISADVAIAGGVLKTVNSPFFGLQNRVRSVLQAVEVLGLRSTTQVVACVALRNAFGGVQLERFWESSAKIAWLSAWLAVNRRWRGVRADEAYTFGLFRDVGIPILLQRMPAYVDVLKVANASPNHDFTAFEKSLLPVSHAGVGALLTRAWWLPDEISNGIAHHHDVAAISPVCICPGLAPASSTLIAISQVAEYFYQRATGLCATREWDKLGSACMERLELGESDLQNLQNEAVAALADM